MIPLTVKQRHAKINQSRTWQFIQLFVFDSNECLTDIECKAEMRAEADGLRTLFSFISYNTDGETHENRVADMDTMSGSHSGQPRLPSPFGLAVFYETCLRRIEH